MIALEWLAPATIGATAIAFASLERIRPATAGERLLRPGWALDLFAYTLAQSYVLGLVIGTILSNLSAIAPSSEGLGLRTWPLGLQLAFFVVSHDLLAYAVHRAQHRFPWLWRIHEAHHSSTHVDWLAGSRSHPVEILVNQTLEYAPIALLSGSADLALAKGVVDAAWGMFIHANLDVRLGPLGYVLNGPEQHRHHHALGYGGRTNFGTKLAIWDTLFGTLRRTDHAPERFGLPDRAYPTSYLGQTLWAFRSRRAARMASPASLD